MNDCYWWWWQWWWWRWRWRCVQQNAIQNWPCAAADTRAIGSRSRSFDATSRVRRPADIIIHSAIYIYACLQTSPSAWFLIYIYLHTICIHSSLCRLYTYREQILMWIITLAPKMFFLLFDQLSGFF